MERLLETFGELDVDGTGTAWDYMDSWGYKDASGTVTFDSTSYWTFGAVNCTDNSTTTIYFKLSISTLSIKMDVQMH